MVSTLDAIADLVRDYAEANGWDCNELPGTNGTRYFGVTGDDSIGISVVVNVTP